MSPGGVEGQTWAGADFGPGTCCLPESQAPLWNSAPTKWPLRVLLRGSNSTHQCSLKSDNQAYCNILLIITNAFRGYVCQGSLRKTETTYFGRRFHTGALGLSKPLTPGGRGGSQTPALPSPEPATMLQARPSHGDWRGLIWSREAPAGSTWHKPPQLC